MSHICPTVTASDLDEYGRQMNVVAKFADRIHIDMMDGKFAPTSSPSLDQVWWPTILKADLHLMYERPGEDIEQIIKLQPNMAIIHYEADVDHMHFAAVMHQHGIRAGLALLQKTSAQEVEAIIHSFDEVLIFSGDLGHHGGQADLSLLSKAQELKAYNSEVEVAWDGGINVENADELAAGGVDVLNVGGYIHESPTPAKAYETLVGLKN